MRINRKILIQQYDVGYVVTNYQTGKKFAKDTVEGVIEVLRDALRTLETKLNSQSKIETIVEAEAETKPSSNPSLVSVPVPEPVITTKHEPEKQSLPQKIKELAQAKDPDGLFIPEFDYDPAQKKEIEGYSNISVVELPDNRAMIQYKVAHYYTTKEKIMSIPYPIPKKHFTGKGLSSVANTCLHAYRKYLHFASIPKENAVSIDRNMAKNKKEVPVGDEQGTCDDISFESCTNNSPENCKFCIDMSRYEDKNKLAAQKPAPPLMRASVPP